MLAMWAANKSWETEKRGQKREKTLMKISRVRMRGRKLLTDG